MHGSPFSFAVLLWVHGCRWGLTSRTPFCINTPSICGTECGTKCGRKRRTKCGTNCWTNNCPASCPGGCPEGCPEGCPRSCQDLRCKPPSRDNTFLRVVSGFERVPRGFPSGFQAVSEWFPCGFRVVSELFPSGFGVFQTCPKTCPGVCPGFLGPQNCPEHCPGVCPGVCFCPLKAVRRIGRGCPADSALWTRNVKTVVYAEPPLSKSHFEIDLWVSSPFWISISYHQPGG